MISFIDLKRQYESIRNEIDESIKKVLENGYFVLGKELESFEKNFASYCNKEYGIGVGNGTDAIFLALKALGIGKEHEVISVPNTAIPTIAAIVATGAKPVFVDIKEDYLIDEKKIERAITKKTRAIIPVHLYGNSCEMDKILEIAKKHNLAVIEDCCQAHGTEYKNKKVPIGNIGCFSFYPSKNLSCYGDGGMIITSSKEIADKLKLLRNYGQEDRYHAYINGYNSRLDEIQAAILNAKLKYLDKWNERRREIARKYDSGLKNIIKIPIENKNIKHVYHLYVVRSKNRDKLIEHLKKKNIASLIHYPIPLHLQKAYSYLGYKEGELPVAETISKEIVSLPCYPELTDEEVGEVVGAVGN